MATPTNLPAAFTVGQVLTSTQQNDLRGAFRVLQVVYGSTASQTTSSSSTLVDTSLSATITPQSSSSKILVMVSQNGMQKTTNNTSITLRIFRGSTDIGLIGLQIGDTNDTSNFSPSGSSISVLDSPATTSATTYKTQFASKANNAIVVLQHNNALSTMILMEVSA